MLQFPAQRLRGKPLQFRLFLGKDYVAEIDGLRVGWILSGTGSEGQRVWWWTVTGPSCGMARVNNVGRSAQLGVAQDELRVCFNRWMDWALKQDGDVIWFGESAYDAGSDSLSPEWTADRSGADPRPFPSGTVSALRFR